MEILIPPIVIEPLRMCDDEGGGGCPGDFGCWEKPGHCDFIFG